MPIPASNGKSYPLEISRTATVDLLKVGSALGSLARKLTPLGMAVGTAAYICAETNICNDAGEWLTGGNPDYADYPLTVPSEGGTWTGHNSTTWPSPEASCSDCARIQVHAGSCSDFEYHDHVYLTGTTYQCRVHRISNPAQIFGAGNTVQQNGCPTGYTDNGGTCTLSDVPHTPTQAEWDAAEQALNQPASTDHIINSGGDLPVDVTTPPAIDNAPISQPIGTTTSTIYDANNNATGTQTKETTLTVTDGATSNAPNQITYNETTIINNYDLNNNLIDSTVTETSAPPPTEPPVIEDIEIEFDSVPENELEEYETPDMDDWTSWGSGSCPPPISINTSNWNGVLDTQPMCDFAEGINPFVLLFAALISAYIVAGIRTSGH